MDKQVENFQLKSPKFYRVLSLLYHHELPGAQAKRVLRRCLQFLDEILPSRNFERNNSTEQFLRRIGHSLGQIAQPELHPKLVRCSELWIW